MQESEDTGSVIVITEHHYKISACGLWLIALISAGCIIFISCIAESFNYVEYNEYALLKNKYTGVRLSRVYEQGRYFYPLTYEMLTFPSTLQTVEFGAFVFSGNGLEFEVEIRFEYLLPKHRIGAIYDEFSMNWHHLIESAAQTTVKGIAAPLNVEVYMKNRTHVQHLFANAVISEMAQIVPVEIPYNLFRVGKVKLPRSILEQSLASSIAIQNNEILQNTQTVAVTRAETSRLVAEIDAQKAQVLNSAVHNANLVKQSAYSSALGAEQKATGAGLKHFFGYLNYTNSAYPNKTMTIVNRLAQMDSGDKIKYVTLSQSALDLMMNV